MATAVATTNGNTAPNQSLYIQNLPEKLQKDDLRRELYMLFSTYGPVFDVVALKTSKMRGQAHVLFRDVQSASQAMRACQGFELSGREMRISYARSRSNTLAKMTGTFSAPATTEKPNAANTATGAASTFAAIPGAASTQAAPGAAVVPASTASPALAKTPGTNAESDGAAPQGVKRAREDDGDEEEEEAEEAEMEVDDDEEMEMSDDD
ncbi:hypothetical protein LTR62_005546 [Meristemomyces frigidus]|uniref:RRM domain-containing protein n=1 Tax=Meristemomyces frigidus TaxID=1508187 RepID=A0AAN7TCR5_9PEZI|nr:hypothetical protein LTR62_005546 [Meristemomyces frigidus]